MTAYEPKRKDTTSLGDAQTIRGHSKGLIKIATDAQIFVIDMRRFAGRYCKLVTGPHALDYFWSAGTSNNTVAPVSPTMTIIDTGGLWVVGVPDFVSADGFTHEVPSSAEPYLCARFNDEKSAEAIGEGNAGWLRVFVK